MRVDGLWHAELIGLLTGLRHHDTVVIADAGLPVPPEVRTVDLGWRRGDPLVPDVLTVVLSELVVESACIAKELDDPATLADLTARLAAFPLDTVAHEELKTLSAQANVVVRTGDDTPFVNVVLHAGVPFGSGAGR